MDDNIYDHHSVRRNDLFYLKSGLAKVFISGEPERISKSMLSAGCYFGTFGFITGLLIPQKAIC